MKRWQIIKKQKTDNKKQTTEDIIKIILQNRGLKTKKQIKEFLNPLSPLNLPAGRQASLTPKILGISKRELNKALKRIKKAIDNKESIIVYSDFDADGICGAAILWETLNSLGAKAMPYIPDRIKEGYGLSKIGIDKVLKEYNAGLIITVDQGITARKGLQYAKKIGIDVIVTDHHVLPKKPPQVLAIVHTTLLSGSGVAWVLAKELKELRKELSSGRSTELSSKESTSDHLALAAIGTIADLIPLIGPSRSIVKYGLKELNKTKRIGLKALFKETGLEKKEIGTYEVGFMIGPRLNAVGRIGHAIDSLRLLCTRDSVQAKSLAQKLNRVNKDRQKLMQETANHAKKTIQPSNHPTIQQAKLIFLSHQSYHEGVIGLVAGKMVEQFYRPAIVVSKGKIYSKASARSIDGFNIVEAIRTCSDLLVDCGGHPMAAGFTVETKYLRKLKSRLEKLAIQEISQEQLTKILKIDCEINLSDISLKLYKKIRELAPFGIGNREPVFATKGVVIQNARTVGGDGKHLKLSISNVSSFSGSEHPPRWPRKVGTPRTVVSVNAIAFNMGSLYPQLSPDKPIDIAYTIILNEWNSRSNLELKIKDIRIKNPKSS